MHCTKMRDVTHTSFPKWKLWMTLFLAGLESLLFAATLGGWPSIVYVFKKDGVFSHLCNHSDDTNMNGPVSTTQPIFPTQSLNNKSFLDHLPAAYPRCSAQDRMFSLVFTIALMFWGTAGIPLGWFFDRYGLLKSRTISVTCGSIGFLIFAWAGYDRYTSYLLFPGSLLMAVASFQTVITCTHMAGLAGPHATTVLSLYIGATSSSIIVFFIVKILHDQGISRKISLTVVASYWLIVLLYSWVVMPHNKVVENRNADRGKEEFDLTKDKGLPSSNVGNDGVSLTSVKMKNGLSQDNDVIPQKDFHVSSGETTQKTDLEPKTLWQCMRTFPYLFFNVWFIAIHMGYLIFLGMYNPWVTELADNDDEKVNHLTNVLAYCQLCALLIGPIAGISIDFCKRRMADRGDMTQGVVTVPFLFVVCTLAIVLHICVIVNRITAVYVSAIVSEFTRTFLFSTALAFVGITFRGQHYGTLFGITHFFACVSNLLQYPLFIWADTSNSYVRVSIFLLVLSLAGYCHPIFMLVYRSRSSRELQEEQLSENRMNNTS